MKKYILYLFICLTFYSCQEKFEERLMREAREFTLKNCPRQIAQDITLDSMVFYPQKPQSISYFYTLGETFKDTTLLKQFKPQLKKTLLEGIQKDLSLKQIKEKGINIVYLYKDQETKRECIKFTFTAKDYQ